MRHILTLSDKNYLSRGLALYGSLLGYGEFTLHYICLDDEIYESLLLKGLPQVRLTRASEVEYLRDFPKLPLYCLYCWAAAPFGIRHVLKDPSIDSLWHLDSDVFMYDDFELLWEGVEGHSVSLVPHASYVSPALGKYNTGTIFFRNDSYGLECLDWWVSLVLNPKNEWAGEYGNFGFQHYADLFADKFRGVGVFPYSQMGSWDNGMYEVLSTTPRLMVRQDGRDIEPLFFHYSIRDLCVMGDDLDHFKGYKEHVASL